MIYGEKRSHLYLNINQRRGKETKTYKRERFKFVISIILFFSVNPYNSWTDLEFSCKRDHSFKATFNSCSAGTFRLLFYNFLAVPLHLEQKWAQISIAFSVYAIVSEASQWETSSHVHFSFISFYHNWCI